MGLLYATYHLLREPETATDYRKRHCQVGTKKAQFFLRKKHTVVGVKNIK